MIKKKKEVKKEKQKFFKVRENFEVYRDNLIIILNSLISNLRLSLGFRISLNYVSHLFKTIFLILFLFLSVFIGILIVITNNQNLNIINKFDKNIITVEDLSNFKSLDEDLFLQIYKGENKIYEDDKIKNTKFYYDDSLGFDKENNSLFIKAKYNNINGNGDYTICIVRNIQSYIRQYFAISIFILFIYVFFSIYFLSKGRNINKKLFMPIEQIVSTAQNITESDLSKRINLEGTKNELKDLAFVINNMLDRIEASYNRQKEFVSDASHELRTPIAVIQGYADLLNRWGKEDKDIMDESIHAILNEASNMKNLVEKLLFLARNDKDTLKIQKEVFNLGELLDEICKGTELITKNRTIIRGEFKDIYIYADKNSIQQAIRILIDNAIKYTEDNGVIEINLTDTENKCMISIKDNGIGIKDEDKQKIFDRFYRAESSRNSEAGGHGLGLSIAKIIVNSHRGDMLVNSKLNEGSEFLIILDKHTVVQEYNTNSSLKTQK